MNTQQFSSQGSLPPRCEPIVEKPVLRTNTHNKLSAGTYLESPVWRCSDCFEEFYYYPLVCDCGCPDFVEGVWCYISTHAIPAEIQSTFHSINVQHVLCIFMKWIRGNSNWKPHNKFFHRKKENQNLKTVLFSLYTWQTTLHITTY